MKRDLSKEHFKQVLNEIMDQVFEGKGEERHGHGASFEDQPWVEITKNVGIGFPVGQALKKLMELRSFENNLSAWEREAYGTGVYVVMSIMFKQYEEEIKRQGKS